MLYEGIIDHKTSCLLRARYLLVCLEDGLLDLQNDRDFQVTQRDSLKVLRAELFPLLLKGEHLESTPHEKPDTSNRPYLRIFRPQVTSSSKRGL